MTATGGLAALGECMQLAFLPSDFDAAIEHWTTVMGVGPFFLIENVALEDMTYKGAPTDAVFTMALAYWGDIQIEFIKPFNDAPSIYSGEYAVRDRLHHVCILVDDIAEAREECRRQGAEILVEGRFGESRVIYADPGTGPGHVVELLQQGTGGPDLFAIIKQASLDWDGSNPVRRFG